jgi:dienelactone hydrolase
VYRPVVRVPSDTLTVYIEGDGLAWLGPSEPSADPTPVDPLALRLALAHADGTAVYLARACQYVGARSPGCSRRFWTTARFAPELVQASDRAIDVLMHRAGAERLVLVGYSGGGAVAALVAARRHDVALLVTVAGNLDPGAWAEHHRVQALEGSLDPTAEIAALRRVRQVHLVGGRDAVVPPDLVQGFAERFPLAQRPRVEVEPDADHACCWAERWPEISRRILGVYAPRRASGPRSASLTTFAFGSLRAPRR